MPCITWKILTITRADARLSCADSSAFWYAGAIQGEGPRKGSESMACRDCTYFEVWKGEGYCNYWRKNTPGDDTCQKDTSGGGGCYITTALCGILGMEDACPVMETLRGFREGTLRGDPRYAPILAEYDTVGPRISARLWADPERETVALRLREDAILPICGLIQAGCASEAVAMYKGMVVGLRDRYGL